MKLVIHNAQTQCGDDDQLALQSLMSAKKHSHYYITSCLHHWHADSLPAKHRLSAVLRDEDSSGQVICFTVLRVTELFLFSVSPSRQICLSARCFHARLDDFVYSTLTAYFTLILYSYVTYWVQEQVVTINICMHSGYWVRTHTAPSSAIWFLYLIPFSEVLHIKATLHDDPRHIPTQDERKLTARLLDIQRVSLHRHRCSTIASCRERVSDYSLSLQLQYSQTWENDQKLE